MSVLFPEIGSLRSLSKPLSCSRVIRRREEVISELLNEPPLFSWLRLLSDKSVVVADVVLLAFRATLFLTITAMARNKSRSDLRGLFLRLVFLILFIIFFPQ